jgi:SnoaL-like protein
MPTCTRHFCRLHRPGSFHWGCRGGSRRQQGAAGCGGSTMTNENSSARDWTDAFGRRTADGFAEVFAESVVLEATTLVNPLQGREKVKQAMAAASRICRSLEFTNAVSAGDKQYLEWVAEAHGGVKFRGVTVLTRDATGSIVHAAIHHRPMRAAMFFLRIAREKSKRRR